MPAVGIVDVSYVAVPATAALPPDPIKLTAMEALLIPIPVLQHVLFYEAAGLPPFDNVVIHSLRSSLGVTLQSFALLAGKLVYIEDTGDVAIACSASDGVKFVTEESADADVRRLAGDEVHDVLRTLEKLVPELDMSKLPTSVLAVEVTRLEGGFAVGVTVHHGVADGKSFWMFVEAWAAACRGETPPAATPCFDRSGIKRHLGEDIARSVLRKYAPNLPEVSELHLLVEERARGSPTGRSPWAGSNSNPSSSASPATAKPTTSHCFGHRPPSSPSSRWRGRSSPDARRPPRTTTATCSSSSSRTSATASTLPSAPNTSALV